MAEIRDGGKEWKRGKTCVDLKAQKRRRKRKRGGEKTCKKDMRTTEKVTTFQFTNQKKKRIG